jgi:hypothetical protein
VRLIAFDGANERADVFLELCSIALVYAQRTKKPGEENGQLYLAGLASSNIIV